MKAVSVQDFIHLADELIQENGEPIKVRSAVGRAYYGAYHAAKNFHDKLPAQGAVIKVGGGVHEQLIQCLENPTLPYSDALFMRSKSLGFLLRRVRKCRHDADYEIAADFSLAEAGTAISQAKTVVAKS